MRPDYCPMANEPCQSMCDVPCSAHRLKPADDSDMAVYKAISKSYTAPQAQQPQLLTDEEIERLRKDAARYQRIKADFRAMSLDASGQHTWVLGRSLMLRGPSVDEALDAAMESK